MADNENLVVLTDENGNDLEFEWLDTITYNDEFYIVLLPLDDDADEVVILLMEYNGEGEPENFLPVEDEETLQAVYEIFQEKNKDKFDFVD